MDFCVLSKDEAKTLEIERQERPGEKEVKVEGRGRGRCIPVARVEGSRGREMMHLT